MEEYNRNAKELLVLQEEIQKIELENDQSQVRIRELKHKFIDLIQWVTMVLETQLAESTPKIIEGIDNLMALRTEEAELLKILTVETQKYSHYQNSRGYSPASSRN